jgi:adenylylsulfate kinase
VLRIGFVANLLTRNGVPVIVSAISPYKAARDQVRREIGEDFIEIFVDCPVEVCAERDVKGLYRRRTLGDPGVHRCLRPLRAAGRSGADPQDERGGARG